MGKIRRNKELKRLIISVTEDCNLRCKYCYVRNRNASSDTSRRMMSPELARMAVRWVMQEYNSVSTVQFFGGEPNLNLPAMEAAVDEMKKLWDSSGLPGNPQFGIVTNLAILTDEILAFYRENGVQPAISLDGPREIHDALRPYSSKGGSHQTIRENIHRLNDAGIHFTIGATFTRVHLAQNITITDLLEYFQGLNAIRADVSTVIANSYPSLDLYGDDQVFSSYLESLKNAVTYWCDSWSQNNPMIFEYVARILRLLSDASEREYFCPAGHSFLAVDSTGQIYPCHMFIGDKDYKLGDIKRDEPITPFEIPLSKDSSCKDCWATSLCIACLGRIKDYCGNLSQLFTPDCVLKKTVIKEVLDNADKLVGRKGVGGVESTWQLRKERA